MVRAAFANGGAAGMSSVERSVNQLEAEVKRLRIELEVARERTFSLETSGKVLIGALERIAIQCESWDPPVSDWWAARLGERAREALESYEQAMELDEREQAQK